MKKVIYTLLLLIASNVSNATTYYWIGGLAPTVNFTNNINWTTNSVTRTPVAATGTLTIAANDIFIFDGTNLGGTTVVTGNAVILATGTIGPLAQLKFTNGANVAFGRTTTGTTKFNINGDGTSAPDLVVDATSVLTLGGSISGANEAIILDTLNQNATGLIDGTVYLSPLSSNTGAHTASYITAGTGELVFSSGSSCYSSDSTTVSCFNGSTANSVIFKSGASLYYYTGRSPVGKNSTTPFIVFESGSNFYIRGSNVSYVDGTTPYTSSSWTSSKTFANVYIQNGATYTADGTVNKIENFTIDAGCSFVTHTTGQTPVTGNLVVNGTLTAPPAGTSNILVLGGNNPQTVSGTGTISVLSLTVCDNSDVTLSKSITTTGTTVNIAGKLDFGTSSVISGSATFTSRVAGNAAGGTGNTVAGSYQITGTSALTGLTGLTISGAGIQPNTNVIGFGTGYINLSKPATATATGVAFTFASNAATLATANPNGFDSLTGCITVLGTKSFNAGTNYIVNAATTYPIGISATVSSSGMTVGSLTLNAPATSNVATKVAGTLTLNTGKLTIRSSDTLRILSSGSIAGSPFSSAKYIVTSVNGSNSGALRIDSFITATIFPIGTATDFLPVVITPSTSYAGFSASDFQGVTADGTLGGSPFTATQKQNVVDAIWNVNRIVGSGNTDVSVNWNAGLEGSNFSTLTDAQVGISRYNSANWTTAIANSASNTLNIATATFGSFGPFAVGKLGDILPVKIANLNATTNNNSVAISFDALNETNIEKYNIERSSNGTNFTTVGSLSAFNNSSERTYHFTDVNVATGTYLYRIAIVDKNGKISYSTLLKVAIQTKITLNVYPNPASNEIVVSGISKGSTIQIIDASGKVVSTKVVSNQSQTVDISRLSKGVFFVRVSNDNGTINNTSFIKD